VPPPTGMGRRSLQLATARPGSDYSLERLRFRNWVEYARVAITSRFVASVPARWNPCLSCRAALRNMRSVGQEGRR